MKAPVRKHPIREPIELRTNMKETFTMVPLNKVPADISVHEQPKEDKTEYLPQIQKSWPSHGVVDTEGKKCIQE